MSEQSPFEKEVRKEILRLIKESDESACVSYISKKLNISRDWARNIFKDMESKGTGYRSGILRQIIKHRYAAWCACSAATSPNCRFKVKQGVEIIESSKALTYFSHNWRVPYLVSDFDLLHRKMRQEIVAKAKKMEIAGFTHGVASKVINMYLKTLHVVPILAMYEHLPKAQQEKINIFHPPIDGELIKALIKNNPCGKKAELKKLPPWTKMKSSDYEKTISIIKEITDGQPWSIERYWPGYR